MLLLPAVAESSSRWRRRPAWVVAAGVVLALMLAGSLGPRASTRASAASAETATLQVIVTGRQGAVSVLGNQVSKVLPPDDDCDVNWTRDNGRSCIYTAPRGQVVTIQPAGGGKFVAWSVFECPGTGACSVTMDSDRTVVATFTPTSLTVVVPFGSIDGTVTSSDGSITCSVKGVAECIGRDFAAFAEVTLTATPPAAFDRWSGACQEAGTSSTCTLLLSGDDVVGAKFKGSSDPEIIPPRQDAQLRVLIEPNGAGKVTSSRSRLSESVNCDPTCDAKYEQGEKPTLTAEPAAGSRFVEWRGGSPYCTTEPTCRYPAFKITRIKAVFEVIPQLQLQVKKAGDGDGTVTSQPGGISCGSICAAPFARGTKVELHAEADTGSRFAGWEGPCTGQDACTLEVRDATEVGARFARVCVAGTAEGFSAMPRKNPRRVVVMFQFGNQASARLQLFRGRRKIAERTFADLGDGTRRVSLGIPRVAPGGTYRVNLRLVDDCGGARVFTKNVSVTRR